MDPLDLGPGLASWVFLNWDRGRRMGIAQLWEVLKGRKDSHSLSICPAMISIAEVNLKNWREDKVVA